MSRQREERDKRRSKGPDEQAEQTLQAQEQHEEQEQAQEQQSQHQDQPHHEAEEVVVEAQTHWS